MKNEELYPELIDYLFSYCGKYFWQGEIKAHMHLHVLAKSNNGVNVAMYKFFMKEENVLDNKEIKDLVNGGFAAFKMKVVARIWNKHRDELELNLCPKCSKIARTPRVKQCQFCFYDWH
jgi:hypothetical protein